MQDLSSGCSEPNEAPFFSAEDADLFQNLFLNAVDGENSTTPVATNNEPRLEDHFVVLKSKSALTPATRIWKQNVRFVFGKRKMLTDYEIDSLKELQDLHYRCAHGGDFRVSFWVEASSQDDDDDDNNNGITKCYLGGVAYVPATEACLRDEIKNNGVPPHKRKRKRIEVSGRPPKTLSERPKHQENEIKQGELTRKRFALRTNENWKEVVRQICQDWIQKSQNWVERAGKRHLVDKLHEDLSRQAIFWDQISIQDIMEDYDHYRQGLHSSLFLDVVNKMGNGMIEWYDQDLQARSSRLGSDRANDDADGHAGGGRSNGHFQGGGGGGGGGGGAASIPPTSHDHSFGGNRGSPDEMNDEGCTVISGDSSDYYCYDDDDDDDDSGPDEDLSLWTGSEYGTSTCETSLLDEDASSSDARPTSEVGLSSSFSREDGMTDGNLAAVEGPVGLEDHSCPDCSGKRFTPRGEVDLPGEKNRQDFRCDVKRESQLENIQIEVPITFRPRYGGTRRYGETRQYWQRQVLKEVTPFLPWQRVAFHGVR